MRAEINFDVYDDMGHNFNQRPSESGFSPLLDDEFVGLTTVPLTNYLSLPSLFSRFPLLSDGSYFFFQELWKNKMSFYIFFVSQYIILFKFSVSRAVTTDTAQNYMDLGSPTSSYNLLY